MANSIKELLSTSPATHLDPSMVELVKRWSDPPKAIEVLEVLDLSIHAALATRVVLYVLEIELVEALKRESISREELIQYAIWRHDDA